MVLGAFHNVLVMVGWHTPINANNLQKAITLDEPSNKENKMFKQTHIAQDQNSPTTYNTSSGLTHSFVKSFQLVWRVIGKMTGIVLNGFHLFVANAEQPSTPKNDYWWDSPTTMGDLFKR